MPRRPSVLLILADDMGCGDFGAFGDGSLATSALDRLVAEGVCLTQHYAGSCVCASSRAALLTGRYPHRTGAIDTFEGRGLDRLALGETTLADVLRGAGCATGLVGKWHLGALSARYHPNARGFNGAKGSVYEGGIHVPAVARRPEGLDAGRHFGEMTHFTDWLPTVLAAAGLEPPRAWPSTARTCCPCCAARAAACAPSAPTG